MKALYPALLALTLLLSGCQSLRNLESPEVSVSDIMLEDITLFEQHWNLTLRVLNPNDRAITINSLDYEIHLNGTRFARGLTGEQVTLNAMSDTQVQTRVTTSILGTLRQLQQLQNKQGEPVNYRLTGQARVAGSPLPLRFDRKGEVTLPALQ